MSATITSDRANLKKRGTMLAYIFSNQGWGSFVGSLVVIIVLACYKSTMEHEGDTSKLDGGMNSVFSFIPPRSCGISFSRLRASLHAPHSWTCVAETLSLVL